MTPEPRNEKGILRALRMLIDWQAEELASSRSVEVVRAEKPTAEGLARCARQGPQVEKEVA